MKCINLLAVLPTEREIMLLLRKDKSYDKLWTRVCTGLLIRKVKAFEDCAFI